MSTTKYSEKNAPLSPAEHNANIQAIRDNEAKVNFLQANIDGTIPYLGSIIPTSTPQGTGSGVWTTTQNGTYTNFGGLVVNANSLAVISRDAVGAFTISQTPVEFNTITTIENVTLLVESWSLVSGMYEYNYVNPAILADSVVDILPYESSFFAILQAEISPMVVSSVGTLKIKAKNLPVANILIAININK